MATRKKIAQLRQSASDKVLRLGDDLTKSADVERELSVALEVEFSKARAAMVLLRTEALEMPHGVTAEDEHEIGAWIEGFAMEALDEALDDMEAARQKFLGPRMFGKKRKAVA